MIKLAGMGKNGRKIMVLGLSDGNIARLREKKPIHIHSEEFGIADLDVIICWGPTEDALTEELSGLIGPQTVVRDHRDDKKD